VLAGDAGEVAVVPEWLFVGGGLLLRWSFAADLPSHPRSRLHGVLERVSPSPVSERWRIRRLTILKAWLMLAKMVLPFVVQGGGAQVPRSADFLVAKGILPIQGFGGGAAGFAEDSHVNRVAWRK
jgi:hypothetical protein